MPLQQKQLPDWKKGDVLSASRLNEIHRLLRRVLHVSPPLELSAFTGGLYLTLRDEEKIWLGEIVESDLYQGTSDYTDHRYFIKPMEVASPGSHGSDFMILQDRTFPAAQDSDIITATNVFEVSDNHALDPGAVVWVHEVPRLSDSGHTDYYIVEDPPETEVLWGYVTSDTWTSDGLRYTCKVYPCDNAYGDGFVASDGAESINLWCPDGKEPIYFESDVLPYIKEAVGDSDEYVGVDAWWDDEIGTLKVWHDVDTIPRGWQEADGQGDSTRDLRGRFVVGYYSDTGLPASSDVGVPGDYASIGETGGDWVHQHGLDPTGDNFELGSGAGAVQNCFTTSDDGRPPYYVVLWIERTS